MGKQIYIILFILFLIGCEDSTGIEDLDPFKIEGKDTLSSVELNKVNELDKIIKPINNTDGLGDYSDLSFYDDINVEIYALGEASHGTKEFFTMKHKIFRYLVEKKGAKIFGFEADMGECIYINRYITEGKYSLDEVMSKMHFWTWNTKEVADLIEWMKNYNLSKSAEEKIHLLGFDNQFHSYQFELILEFVNNHNIDFPENSKFFLENFETKISREQYQAMSSTEITNITNKVDTILTYFDSNRDDIIQKSSEFEFEQIRQLAVNINQVLYTATNHKNSRDYYMYKNAKWMSEKLSGGNPIALWAHNAHLANDPLYGLGSMGYYLSNEFNENYHMTAFGFSTGAVRAYNYNSGLGTYQFELNPINSSLNYIFHFTKHQNFVVNIQDIIDNSTLKIWFSQNSPMLEIGAVFRKNELENYRTLDHSKLYDHLIYLKFTTAARSF